jgi:hypothetical protein
LQVTIDSAECDFIANIRDPQIAKVGFGDGLVDGLILLDAAEEVAFGHFTWKVLVVRIARGDLKGNVGSNDSGIVAYGLEEYDGHALFFGNAGGDFGTK